MRGDRVWSVLFTLALASFTVYAVLDTFVITHVYATVGTTATSTATSGATTTGLASASATTSSASATSTGSPISGSSTQIALPDDAEVVGTCSDGGTQVTVYSYRVDDSTVYVADVQLSSASSLQTAFAQSSYGKNVTETTSDMAGDVGAVLAINGDFYGAQESGYVIRNGVLYRDTVRDGQEDLVIYADGGFEIVDESSVSAEQLLADGAQQVLSFGPGLVEDGQIAVSENDEVDKAMTGNPRTAIGIIDDLHYVFVVSDGRTSESTGLTLYQLAQVMSDLGVQTAYNLDGGGSSTMVFQGSVVNNPTSGNGISERKVSDIVYVV